MKKSTSIYGYISAHARIIPNKIVVIPEGFELLPLAKKGDNLLNTGEQYTPEVIEKLKTIKGREQLFKTNNKDFGHIYNAGDAIFDMSFDFDLNYGKISGMTQDIRIFNNNNKLIKLDNYLKDNKCDITLSKTNYSSIKFNNSIDIDYSFSSAGIITGDSNDYIHIKEDNNIKKALNEALKQIYIDMLKENNTNIYSNDEILQKSVTLGEILKRLKDKKKKGKYILGVCRGCDTNPVLYEKCREKNKDLPEKLVEEKKEDDLLPLPLLDKLTRQSSLNDTEMFQFKNKMDIILDDFKKFRIDKLSELIKNNNKVIEIKNKLFEDNYLKNYLNEYQKSRLNDNIDKYFNIIKLIIEYEKNSYTISLENACTILNYYRIINEKVQIEKNINNSTPFNKHLAILEYFETDTFNKITINSNFIIITQEGVNRTLLKKDIKKYILDSNLESKNNFEKYKQKLRDAINKHQKGGNIKLKYKNKYLKYKNKYLKLKNSNSLILKGGGVDKLELKEEIISITKLTSEQKNMLYNMYKKTYGGAGNTLWFKSTRELFDNPSYACIIIIKDKDKDIIKAYSIFQKKKHVNKLSLTCHDGTDEGKKISIELRLKYVNTPNWVIEASGATSWILRKNNTKYIKDIDNIKKLLDIDDKKELIELNPFFDEEEYETNKNLFHYYHIYKEGDKTYKNKETLFGTLGCMKFKDDSCNRICIEKLI